MKTYLGIEVYGKDGRLKSRLYRPSRSWEIGMLQLLYMQMAQLTFGVKTGQYGYRAALAVTDTAGPLLRVCGPARAGTFLSYVAGAPSALQFADMAGIQVGFGTTAENSGHVSMESRFSSLPWKPTRTVYPPNMAKTYQGAATDGTDLWVVNTTDNTIHRLNIFTGAEIGSWAAPAAGCVDVCYDVDNDQLWCWCSGGPNRVYNMHKTTGVSTVNWAGGANVLAIAYDDVLDFICLTRSGDVNISRFNLAGGAQASIVTAVNGAYGLAYNGVDFYMVKSNSIYKVDMAGAITASYTEGWTTCWGAQYQGGYLWVNDYTSKAIYRLLVTSSGMQVTPTEIVDWLVAGDDATFILRCFATNHSGGDLTISEVGLCSSPFAVLLARDVLGVASVLLHDTEMAKITYQPKITV